jgi:hypothetical protein
VRDDAPDLDRFAAALTEQIELWATGWDELPITLAHRLEVWLQDYLGPGAFRPDVRVRMEKTLTVVLPTTAAMRPEDDRTFRFRPRYALVGVTSEPVHDPWAAVIAR